MASSPLDITNFLVQPPGDLLYFLVVIMVSQASWFMALGHRLRFPRGPGAGRYALAVSGVLLAWLLLLVGALFALLANRPPTSIIPPLERAANVITLLLVGWAFVTADHKRWRRTSTLALLLLLLVVIAGYVLTAAQWIDLSTRADFNLSAYGMAWALVPVVLAALGLVVTLLFFRMIVDAPLKLVFFAVLLFGYGSTLMNMAQGSLLGNYAGPARLAFLVALVVLPSVVYRLAIRQLQAAVKTPPQSPLGQVKTTAPPDAPPAAAQPDRQSVQLLKSLGVMLDAARPEDIPQRILTAAMDALRADVVVLLRVQDANYADMTLGRDRVMGRPISGIALNLEDQPTLLNAIERHAQRPLYPDRNAEELQDLYTRLDIDQIGPVYFQPLVHNQELVAVLLVGTPYSRYELSSQEIELLKGLGVISSGLLSLSYAAQEATTAAGERAIHAMVEGLAPDEVDEAAVVAARREMESSLQLARDQIAQLSRQVMELKLQLDDERSRAAAVLGDSEEALSISQRLAALTREQSELREERQALMRRLKEAEAALSGAVGTSSETVIQDMVDALRREKENLLAERDQLQAELQALRSADGTPVPPDLQQMLSRMTLEKVQLMEERDQLSGKLDELDKQLETLGIEGGTSGLSQLINQLFEQRSTLTARVEALKAERDALLNERKRSEEGLSQVEERETRIKSLQTEIKHLAADREAATRKLEKLRVERDELNATLAAVKQHRARLLAQAAGFEMELAEAHEEQSGLRIKLQELADARSDLINERDRLLAEKHALEIERDQLLARAEGDRQRLQELGEVGVGQLRTMIHDLTEDRARLEHELNETSTMLARIQNELDAIRVTGVAPSTDGERVERYLPDEPELMLGLVQELRTPMTSITGYVDLLLGESAGILGEMQRKFLQRVSANVSRLASMIDDLVQVTEMDMGQFRLAPKLVDMISIIEDAITTAANQLREKGLSISLNIDDDLPSVPADEDALEQIIGQLLTNAYLVSPPNSEITIAAHRRSIKLSQNGRPEEMTDCVFVSVEDRGGGILPEDIPRVFARKYKAENPLISGLGDTGVGLSIAKALVEAHNGRLWVETRPGLGSVFNFALPLVPLQQPEEG